MTTSQLLLKYMDRWVGPLVTALLPQLSPRQIPPDPKSVLLVRPGGIGDAVLLIPAVRALQAKFPNASIDILAERRNAGVFALCTGIRSVRRYDVPSEFVASLCHDYDVIIDTEQWHRLSAVVARVVRAKVRIGFGTNDRSRLFTHTAIYAQEDYEGDSFMRLMAPLGINGSGESNNCFLKVSNHDAERVGKILSLMNERPFVALFPGASIAERRWGCEMFGMLAKHLINHGIGVVAVGGEAEMVEGRVVEAAGGLSLCGMTGLGGTAAVVSRSSMLISGDSGILHIAVGLGVPTVSLFGPGIQEKWGPRGDNHIVINKRLPCSPCTKFGYTPKCPYNARCMKEITVDEVESAVLELLARLERK